MKRMGVLTLKLTIFVWSGREFTPGERPEEAEEEEGVSSLMWPFISKEKK